MRHFSRRYLSLYSANILFCLLFVCVDEVRSENLPQPTGPVLLEVAGSLENRNAPDGVVFDRDMLWSLVDSIIDSSTIWTDGVKRFRGVLVSAILEATGAKGAEIDALAHDEYVISIPRAELEQYGVILALEMDGKPLTTRTKGPVWMIYPRDSFPELQEDIYNLRMVWHTKRLTVK